MLTANSTRDLRDCFEYDGNTAVEHVRKSGRRTVWREWILFDSVDEALDFYDEQAAA